MKTITVRELNNLVDTGKLVEHHTSWARGYVSRKTGATVAEAYTGKFGSGYKVYSPSWSSTQYCLVTYYVAA